MPRMRSNAPDDLFTPGRELMKSGIGVRPSGPSAQQRGEPQPALEAPRPPDARILALPNPASRPLRTPDLRDCLRRRRSRREFLPAALALDELAFLLWATQGLTSPDVEVCFRAAPSAGARHPFETHLAVFNVSGLQAGVHRYLPLSHELLFRYAGDLREEASEAALGQTFVGEGAAVFFWSCLPCRGEWRYGPHAHKYMLLDAGHVCQNLYLACEALGCGTCGIGAYHQAKADRLLRLDGREEFVVYFAPVGRVER